MLFNYAFTGLALAAQSFAAPANNAGAQLQRRVT